ncbi:transposase [Rhizobium mesoamericanum]|uniref:transposase n=1 Tax=Rhizobium mesoamericanum TaxID=1079800 RepID=UPI003522C048
MGIISEFDDVAETGDIRRFELLRQLMTFLGLVPQANMSNVARSRNCQGLPHTD